MKKKGEKHKTKKKEKEEGKKRGKRKKKWGKLVCNRREINGFKKKVSKV